MVQKYIVEFWYLKKYVIVISLVILLSYSVYFFCSDAMIVKFNDEDQFFEIGTAVLFIITSIIYFITYQKRKNIFLLFFSILMFVGAGEELSWGQVFLKYKTPAELKHINVQGEFNLHNIEIFNTNNFNKTHKTGLHRLLEINFLFRIFIMTYGIVLPLLTNHIPYFRKIIMRRNFPVAPFSLGVFFLISWLGLQGLLIFLPKGKSEWYYSSAVEIFEFLTSFIFFSISYYFLQESYNKQISNAGI
jgi:hypothetical protein